MAQKRQSKPFAKKRPTESEGRKPAGKSPQRKTSSNAAEARGSKPSRDRFSARSENRSSENRPAPRYARDEKKESSQSGASRSRTDSRESSRPESRPGSRPASRPGSRPASRPGSRPASRPGSRPASRPDSRPAPRTAREEAPNRSKGFGRERFSRDSEQPAREKSFEKRFEKERPSREKERFVRQEGERNRPAARAYVPKKDFYVWGRRPVEAYLADLNAAQGQEDSEEEFKAAQYKLHIIADKAGKVPLQLKNSVELAQNLGIKIQLHKSQNAEDEWPLGDEEPVNHQRVCLKTPKLLTSDLTEVLAITRQAKENETRGCIGIVLDQIQDPRNFGAILRSAAFFGVSFVLFGQDRQAELSPLVVRTSAGGAFSVKLVPVVNLSRALAQLKDAGAWVIATHVKDARPARDIPLDRPYLLVLGNEGKGVRPEVSKHSDFTVTIPGAGAPTVDSLNVSVAAGVLISQLAVNTETGDTEAQTDDFDADFDDEE